MRRVSHENVWSKVSSTGKSGNVNGTSDQVCATASFKFQSIANHFALFIFQINRESELMIDTTRAKTDQCKKESDYRIKERVQNIEFLTEEIGSKKKEVSIEEDVVKSYCKRLINAIKFIKDIQEKNRKQYTILGEDKHKAPQNNDTVFRELIQEKMELQTNYDKLDTLLMRLIEKSRLLRAVIYTLDSELLRKSASLEIDKNNLDLRTNFRPMDFDLTKQRIQSDPVYAFQEQNWINFRNIFIFFIFQCYNANRMGATNSQFTTEIVE